ncbi:KYNU [Bugula neritina]|uniref:KYNU n=1 Tax=Bugula neritina TaxID=10212 RepID=A0A7J7K672_BUGNE|nr:KYNU [Bugula neritina]
MCASLKASLNIYHQTSLEELRNKSIMLTGYLEWLIRHYFSSDSPGFSSQSTIRILTPPQPERRGCQLSLCFSIPLSDIYEKLSLAGVSCDKREPSVIRIAPVHLYNSFEDVYKFVEILRGILYHMTVFGHMIKFNSGHFTYDIGVYYSDKTIKETC